MKKQSAIKEEGVSFKVGQEISVPVPGELRVKFLTVEVVDRDNNKLECRDAHGERFTVSMDARIVIEQDVESDESDRISTEPAREPVDEESHEVLRSLTSEVGA